MTHRPLWKFFSTRKGALATGASQPLLRYLSLSLYLSLSHLRSPLPGSLKGAYAFSSGDSRYLGLSAHDISAFSLSSVPLIGR